MPDIWEDLATIDVFAADEISEGRTVMLAYHDQDQISTLWPPT